VISCSSTGLFLSPFAGPMDSKYMLVVHIRPIGSESTSNNITNRDFLPKCMCCDDARNSGLGLILDETADISRTEQVSTTLKASLDFVM